VSESLVSAGEGPGSLHSRTRRLGPWWLEDGGSHGNDVGRVVPSWQRSNARLSSSVSTLG
jgi:hypothetical protein